MVNAERKSEILSIEYVVDKKTLRNGFKNKCWESKSSRLYRKPTGLAFPFLMGLVNKNILKTFVNELF